MRHADRSHELEYAEFDRIEAEAQKRSPVALSVLAAVNKRYCDVIFGPGGGMRTPEACDLATVSDGLLALVDEGQDVPAEIGAAILEVVR